MRLSQMIMDLLEWCFPVPPSSLPPSPSVDRPPSSPSLLTDKDLDDIKAIVENLHAKQIEQMLALYGEVATIGAEPEDIP
jgi:hypothetical protein